MQWVFADPGRFLRERESLEALVAEVEWLSFAWRIGTDSAIEVDLTLVVHGRHFVGRMTYPDVFPNSPPFIRPLDPSAFWSRHQYGAGGPLCLEWRPDNWQPDVTGADLIRSAHALLLAEQNPEVPGVVPSAHRVTLGQISRAKEYRFVATPALQGLLRTMPMDSYTKVATRTLAHESATVRFVAEVTQGDAGIAVDDLPIGVSNYFPLFSWHDEGWAFRSGKFESLGALASPNDLIELLVRAGFDPAVFTRPDEKTGKPPTPLVILLADDAAPLRVYSLDSNEPPNLHEHVVIGSEPAVPRLSQESASLGNLRLGIAGLGSIGSKVAMSLARAGVRRFLLVDDDIFEPGNVVRHELNWSSVGLHKASAVREQLRLIAPDMSVEVRLHRLAGQESSATAAALLKDLSECDLLIDATANPEVFLRLAGVARSACVPLVWGEVFAGGYGGLIARARPDLDPNPLAVRDGFHVFLESQPVAPFQQAVDYDTGSEVTHIAFDSDVGFVANALARLAIDTGLRRVPSEFPYPVYLLGMRQEWIFGQPFDTRPVAVDGAGWDVPHSDADQEAHLQALRALVTIHEEQQRADGSTTS